MYNFITVEPPSSPSNARINGIRNGSHSATVELAWDANHESNDTNFSISISSNGEPWLSRAAVEDNEASIILTYNTDYTLAVMSANCAGHGEVSSTLDIFLGRSHVCMWYRIKNVYILFCS